MSENKLSKGEEYAAYSSAYGTGIEGKEGIDGREDQEASGKSRYNRRVGTYGTERFGG